MADRILQFPVPKSTELLTYLEHVAPPPIWKTAPRLLAICGLPKNPAEIAEGFIHWNRFGHTTAAREGYAVKLRYSIADYPSRAGNRQGSGSACASIVLTDRSSSKFPCARISAVSLH